MFLGSRCQVCVSSILVTPSQWRERCKVLFFPFSFSMWMRRQRDEMGVVLSLERRHVELFHLAFDPTTSPLKKVCLCVFVIAQIWSSVTLLWSKWNGISLLFPYCISPQRFRRMCARALEARSSMDMWIHSMPIWKCPHSLGNSKAMISLFSFPSLMLWKQKRRKMASGSLAPLFHHR